eukprot:TRINITY_DN60713_c0_g2_i1.p1 TRINITY_DN60713_c0_g2~~TRINITY_DN60713_c0_g2_i1.p1  ORF type:complete len:137 (-),score=19.97 TRINITY_DN60713_c0_g2_i1:9-365(-)
MAAPRAVASRIASCLTFAWIAPLSFTTSVTCPCIASSANSSQTSSVAPSRFAISTATCRAASEDAPDANAAAPAAKAATLAVVSLPHPLARASCAAAEAAFSADPPSVARAAPSRLAS